MNLSLSGQVQIKCKNKTERSPAPFRYMVEDKMKKMKNCYLQLLIYPKDVSY